jgi:hypothetical protein
MNKKHLLWWIFDFLQREHPNALTDMQERLVGDTGEKWVKGALAEGLTAFAEASPAGYKFLAEFRQGGNPSTFKDLVVYDAHRDSAEAQAAKHLAGADKMDMIILSHDDLKQLSLRPGQMRTVNGIVQIK